MLEYSLFGFPLVSECFLIDNDTDRLRLDICEKKSTMNFIYSSNILKIEKYKIKIFHNVFKISVLVCLQTVLSCNKHQ